METLGAVVPVDAARPGKLRRTGSASSFHAEVVFHLGSVSNPHVASVDTPSGLGSFMDALRGVDMPRPQHFKDILDTDRNYNAALTGVKGMGPASQYVRPHIRRKRLYMICSEHPLLAEQLWNSVSVRALRDMVPDMTEVLADFALDMPAATVNKLFGFPVATGPLLISCFGCICKPLLNSTLSMSPKGLRALEAAREMYLAEQHGAKWVCEPCPEVLAERVLQKQRPASSRASSVGTPVKRPPGSRSTPQKQHVGKKAGRTLRVAKATMKSQRRGRI